MEKFCFVSFKEHCDDTRKISRKRHLLEIEEKEIYPPEGHLAFHVLEQSDLRASPSDLSDSSDEDCDVELHQDEAEAEQNLDLVHSVYYVGGASRAEPSTWQFANNIYVYTFQSSQNDIWIEDANYYNKTKIIGSQIPPLSGSAGFGLGQGSFQKFVFWGGQNVVDGLRPTNDMFIISKRIVRKRVKFDSNIYLSSVGEEFDKEMLSNAKKQFGDIPSERFGHSLSKVSDSAAIMFGGLCCPYYDTVQIDCSSMFRKELADGDVYLLELKDSDTDASPTWKRLKGNETDILRRAYHTTTKVLGNSLAVIVGITYENGKPHKRLSLQNIILLSDLDQSNISFKEVKLPDDVKNVFISGHSTASPDNERNLLYIYGGYQQTTELITKPVQPSSELFVIDIEKALVLRKVAPSEYGTSGSSLVFLEPDVLLISGGTKKALLLYTSKTLIPDKCDLQSDCQIDENFVSPIPWIFCEGKCQRWLHQFCVNLKVVPKGDYICDQCKKKRSSKSDSTKKTKNKKK